MYQQFNPRFLSSRFEILQSESTQVITVNVVCDGSPSRMRRVRLISFGITTRPNSSILLTMPVARIKTPPIAQTDPSFEPSRLQMISHTSSRVRSLRESGRFMRGGQSPRRAPNAAIFRFCMRTYRNDGMIFCRFCTDPALLTNDAQRDIADNRIGNGTEPLPGIPNEERFQYSNTIDKEAIV